MALTDCALINGDELDCRDSVGGIEEIYVTEFENKLALTESSGIITAFTLSTGKKFWTYKLEKENAEANETASVSIENGTIFFDQSIAVMLKKWSAAKRNNVNLLSQNRLLLIAKYRTGVYVLYGKTAGVDLTVIEGKSGKAYGDLNGFTLTFTGKEPKLAPQVTASLLTTLTVPA